MRLGVRFSPGAPVSHPPNRARTRIAHVSGVREVILLPPIASVDVQQNGMRPAENVFGGHSSLPAAQIFCESKGAVAIGNCRAALPRCARLGQPRAAVPTRADSA